MRRRSSTASCAHWKKMLHRWPWSRPWNGNRSQLGQTRSSESKRAGRERGDRPSFRRTLGPAKIVSPNSLIPPTGATVTRSPTAPTAVLALRSRDRFPYDRATTTMSGFTMCPDCQREYDDSSRTAAFTPSQTPVRYVAHRSSCWTSSGYELQRPNREDPIRRTAPGCYVDRAIVAIKGLGGYHLACDPFDAAAVTDPAESQGAPGQTSSRSWLATWSQVRATLPRELGRRDAPHLSATSHSVLLEQSGG